MAGTSDPTKAPHPYGKNSTVAIRIGGNIPTGQTAMVVDTFVLPWDCFVRGVDRSYSKTLTNHIDALTLKTVDSTALTIVASLDASADIAGVEQTLHSDIIGTKLVKGNKIQMKADTSGTTEAGFAVDTLHLEPAYS